MAQRKTLPQPPHKPRLQDSRVRIINGEVIADELLVEGITAGRFEVVAVRHLSALNERTNDFPIHRPIE